MNLTLANPLNFLTENRMTVLMLLAMLATALFFIPIEAFAVGAGLPDVGTDGGAIATDTSSIIKKYGEIAVYIIGAVVFIAAAMWIVGAVGDWRNNRATLGGVIITMVIAIIAAIFVMYLLKLGLDVLANLGA